MQNQINGGSIHVPGGASNVKILSKTKNHSELNGGNRDRTEFSQSKGGSHGRPGMSSVGKQNRYTRIFLTISQVFVLSLVSDYKLFENFQGSWGRV